MIITLTPDVDSGGATSDGLIQRYVAAEPWAAIRDGEGTQLNASQATLTVSILASIISDQWNGLGRAFFSFDMSDLPEGEPTSVTFRVYVASKSNTLGASVGDSQLMLVYAWPDDPGTLAITDYQNIADYSPLAEPANYADVEVGGYLDFDMTSDDYEWIIPGVISMALRLGCDYDGLTPPWVSASSLYYGFEFAESDNPPELIFVYPDDDYDSPGDDYDSPGNGDDNGGDDVSISTATVEKNMYWGNTFRLRITVTEDGEPVDLTGLEFWFRMTDRKRNVITTDDVTITRDDANGIVDIDVDYETMQTLKGCTARFELDYTSAEPNPERYTLFRGYLYQLDTLRKWSADYDS